MPSKTLPKTLPENLQETSKFKALVKMANEYHQGFIGNGQLIGHEIKGLTIKFHFHDDFYDNTYYIIAKMKYDGVLTLEKMYFE